MKTILRLGRDPKNDLTFEDKKISRQHCIIKEVPEGFLVSDLDSSWGTFLNGRRIAQGLFDPSDTLTLGTVLQLNLPAILSLLGQPAARFPISYATLLKEKEKQTEQARIYEEFLKLEAIYDEHMKTKKQLLRKDTLRKTGLRAGLSLIPIVGIALGQLSGGVGENLREKIMDMDEAFKSKYVCPKCFSYLGAEPFENLKRRGKCQRCGVKWFPES